MVKKAFTLVELLVVIGIIALLIGILMPALTSARVAASRVQCLSNMRQMVIAAVNYAALNAGHYPSAYYGVSTPDVAIAYNWDFTVTTDLHTGKLTITPGLLWGGSTDARIQQCPSYDGRSNTLADPYTGYNYNTSYIGRGDLEVIKSPAKLGQVKNSAGCILFGDGQWRNGANKFMRCPQTSPGDGTFSGRTAGTQGLRHGKMTNAAFADGHAESFRQLYSAGYAGLPADCGFFSPDNSMYDLE